MALRGFFRNHGAFVLVSFLVLFGGLYSACSAGDDNNADPAEDSGRKDDAPRSNRAR
jgi:hypothetical protein